MTLNPSQARTRFAPSPNGPLHLGHAYAAMRAHDLARDLGGEFLVRIEDIDTTRSKPALVTGIIEDLRWLGLDWDEPLLFQSTRLAAYRRSLERLRSLDLAYPCFCTRSQIAEAQQKAGAVIGPDGALYPGTCRSLSERVREVRMVDAAHCWRLNCERARSLCGPLHWHDIDAGEQLARPELFGDVVLVRKDAPASYHLAAPIDDAFQQISHVARGADLFTATHVHRLLQALLELPVPLYWHHDLLAGTDGRKLSKSEGSSALANLRKQGLDGPDLLDQLRKGQLPTGISRLAGSYTNI